MQPKFNIDPPSSKKEKISIIIDNRKKEFKNKNENSETDELEANGHISIESFKNWLVKSYIDMEHMKNVLVKNNLSKLTERKVRLLLIIYQAKFVAENYLTIQNFYSNFIDFYMQNGVVK